MAKKKWYKPAALLFVVLAGSVFFLPSSAQAQTTQQKLDQLQSELKQLKQNIANIEDEAERAQAEKDSLQQQNSIIQEQIATLDGGIDAAKEALAAKQADLDQKRRDIEESEDLFEQRLRAMYVMHQSGALSTLLGVNSFEELLTASTTLSRISIADTDLLAQLAEQKAAIEADEAYIEKQITEMENDMAAKEEKQSELAANLVAADNSLTQLEAEKQVAEADYAATLSAYNQARAQAETEMNQSSSNSEYVGGAFGWPVPGYSGISSYYGPRTLYGQYDFHTGIDITGANVYGANIVASQAGVVQTVRYGSTGYGYYVILDHGGNYKTLYGHMSGIAVQVGQQVSQGQVIGYVGSTGNSTGPHLHFEIRVAGQQVDPLPYLQG